MKSGFEPRYCRSKKAHYQLSLQDILLPNFLDQYRNISYINKRGWRKKSEILSQIKYNSCAYMLKSAWKIVTRTIAVVPL